MEDCWDLIPYNVPWGPEYYDYKPGILPGPDGTFCYFLRSPTPLKNQRTTLACQICRQRKAKCSGARPSCTRCSARGYHCDYISKSKRESGATASPSFIHCRQILTPHVRKARRASGTASITSGNADSYPSSPTSSLSPKCEDPDDVLFTAHLSYPDVELHPKTFSVGDDLWSSAENSLITGDAVSPLSAYTGYEKMGTLSGDRMVESAADPCAEISYSSTATHDSEALVLHAPRPILFSHSPAYLPPYNNEERDIAIDPSMNISYCTSRIVEGYLSLSTHTFSQGSGDIHLYTDQGDILTSMMVPSAHDPEHQYYNTAAYTLDDSGLHDTVNNPDIS